MQRDAVVGVDGVGPVRLEQPVTVLLMRVGHQRGLRRLVSADRHPLGGDAAERRGADDAGRDARGAEDLADGAHRKSPDEAGTSEPTDSELTDPELTDPALTDPALIGPGEPTNLRGTR